MNFLRYLSKSFQSPPPPPSKVKRDESRNIPGFGDDDDDDVNNDNNNNNKRQLLKKYENKTSFKSTSSNGNSMDNNYDETESVGSEAGEVESMFTNSPIFNRFINIGEFKNLLDILVKNTLNPNNDDNEVDIDVDIDGNENQKATSTNTNTTNNQMMIGDDNNENIKFPISYNNLTVKQLQNAHENICSTLIHLFQEQFKEGNYKNFKKAYDSYKREKRKEKVKQNQNILDDSFKKKYTCFILIYESILKKFGDLTKNDIDLLYTCLSKNKTNRQIILHNNNNGDKLDFLNMFLNKLKPEEIEQENVNQDETQNVNPITSTKLINIPAGEEFIQNGEDTTFMMKERFNSRLIFVFNENNNNNNNFNAFKINVSVLLRKNLSGDTPLHSQLAEIYKENNTALFYHQIKLHFQFLLM